MEADVACSTSFKRGRNESAPLLDKIGVAGDKVPRSFDEALEGAGVGVYHVILLLVAGWALASDSVEVQCISFVTPQLDNPNSQLHPTKVQEGILDAIIFLGMMVGGYFWGSWSDVVGRRSCLITSLTVNGLFGFASALSPNYALFLVFRFFSGVGVGGSLPVAFSYFCEFFTKKTRGAFVIILASFWIVGSIFAAMVAWAVIPNLETQGSIGSVELSSWRVYIMLCTIPCLSAAIALLFMPESPYFLYYKGKTEKTMKVLSRIRRVNACCSWKTLPPVPLIEAETKQQGSSNILSKVLSIFRSTKELFTPAYFRPSVVLIVIWFTFSFGYYGLILWFPEYFKCIQEQTNNCTFNINATLCAPPGTTTICSSHDNTQKIYLDSLYTALAGIPGTVLGVFTVNIIGPRIMLTTSIIASAVSTFLIWGVPKQESVIVILSSVFNGVSIVGWNSLDVLSTSDLFPVHLRSTAFGIQAVFGRVGSIIGNVAFGKLIKADPFIPILLVAVLLMVGGIVAIFLPSPRVDRLKRKLCRCCRSMCDRRDISVPRSRTNSGSINK